MKVTVDSDYCGGHGACVVTAPAVFFITNGGYADVIAGEFGDQSAIVLQAERECPTGAITVVIDESI